MSEQVQNILIQLLNETENTGITKYMGIIEKFMSFNKGIMSESEVKDLFKLLYTHKNKKENEEYVLELALEYLLFYSRCKDEKKRNYFLYEVILNSYIKIKSISFINKKLANGFDYELLREIISLCRKYSITNIEALIEALELYKEIGFDVIKNYIIETTDVDFKEGNTLISDPSYIYFELCKRNKDYNLEELNKLIFEKMLDYNKSYRNKNKNYVVYKNVKYYKERQKDGRYFFYVQEPTDKYKVPSTSKVYNKAIKKFHRERLLTNRHNAILESIIEYDNNKYLHLKYSQGIISNDVDIYNEITDDKTKSFIQYHYRYYPELFYDNTTYLIRDNLKFIKGDETPITDIIAKTIQNNPQCKSLRFEISDLYKKIGDKILEYKDLDVFEFLRKIRYQELEEL